MRTIQLPDISYSTFLNKVFEKLHVEWNIIGKYRIIRFLQLIFGEKRIITKSQFNFKIAADPKDLIQRKILYSNVYEPELSKRIREKIKNGLIFYDIGANVGYYSLLAHSFGATVVSFEPDPINAKIIQYNYFINSFKSNRTLIQNYALGVNTAELPFHRANVANTGISGLTKNSNSIVDIFTVKVLSLDQAIQLYNLPFPSVIKIDVEGWELAVLEGSKNLFDKNPPEFVFFEAKANSKGQIIDTRLFTFFQKYSYCIDWIPRDNGIIEENENYVAYLTKQNLIKL